MNKKKPKNFITKQIISCTHNDRSIAVTLSQFKLMRIVGRGAFGKVNDTHIYLKLSISSYHIHVGPDCGASRISYIICIKVYQ